MPAFCPSRGLETCEKPEICVDSSLDAVPGGAEVLEFSPFRLDLEDERLWRGDKAVDLRPKTFQVLRYLVENAGRLATTAELLDAVWPDVEVGPGAVTKVIAELRRALGDDARHPLFIQTVHRRGVRFVARLVAHPDGEAPHSAPGAPLPRWGRWLFGREAELDRLDQLLSEARAGRRQLVFVTGEPGIGKTSLLRAFLERLGDEALEEPVWVAGGRCVELHGEGEAYLPVLETLDRLTREAGPKDVVQTLGRFAPSWLAQLPWLGEADAAQEIQGPTPAPTPARMLREFCVAVEALSRERPLVLWLEDLHWSDAATVDLLAALATRSDPARLLVLATYRPVEAAAASHPVAPLKRALVRQHACAELELGPLHETAVRAYLSQRLTAEPDPALTSLIYEHSEGNPLFMVTLVDHLLAEGWLENAGTGWQPASSLEAFGEAAPGSLAAVVGAQLERVDAEELAVLQAASVVGESFAAQALAAALGEEAVTVEKVCGRLAAWGRFLEPVGPGRWPDGSAGERYRFQHAVFRHVLYQGVAAGQRQQLHHAIAERLEAGYASQPGAIAAELALHFEAGGDPERAVRCLVQAAAGVRQRSGDREAVAYFERALGLLATLPEAEERDRRELELRVQLWVEVNVSAVVSAVDQDASLERALELCDRLGDLHSRAYISSYRTRSLIIEAELDAAASFDEQRVEHASSAGDPVLLAAAHSEIGDIAFYRGELERAQREQALCLRALDGFDPREAWKPLGHDPGVLAHGYLGWISWLRGRPDEARRHAATCRARAEAGGYALNQAFALAQALLVEQLRRDADAAGELAKAYAALAEEYGFVLPYPTVCAVMSWTLAQGGEVDAAIAQLREGAAVSRRLRTRQGSSQLLATLAEAELARGCAKEGLSAIDEALAFVEQGGERFLEAEVHRLRGELLRLDRKDEPAEACFQTALDVARGQGALSLELRAATSLSRLWHDTGRSREARPLLSDVYGRFHGGFDTLDLREARVMMDSL
jgi:DNA-binding winged helix-turn-helix (wHTH) protein/tetratricopeptide (TPR) repeat protein